MTRFAEDPLPAILIGLGVLSILLIAYLQMRRLSVLVAIVTVTLLTCSAVVMEQLVVTEREKIEYTLYGITEAAEANDMPGVLGWLAPGASRIRGQVKRHMPNSDIERARVLTAPKITIDLATSPPTARAEFNAFVSGYWGRDRILGAQRADVVVHLESAGDTWLITELDGIDDR